MSVLKDRDRVHRARIAVAPFVESFHSRVRDELLDVEEFSCLTEARVVIKDWQQDYNWRRPHSALGMLAPAVFAAAAQHPAVTRV